MDTNTLLLRLPESVTIEGSFAENMVFVDGAVLPLKRSLSVRNHSPTGFQWGYGGSGPAQFALALLLKYWPEEQATKHYQALKFAWVGGLPRTDFIKTINLRQIMHDVITKHEPKL